MNLRFIVGFILVLLGRACFTDMKKTRNPKLLDLQHEFYLNSENWGHVDLNYLSILKAILPDANQSSFNFPNVSRPCRIAWETLLVPGSNILNILDAWGKIPSRILLGNLQFIGAYDECKGIPEVKYCSSSMTFLNTSTTGMYGSCFPDACTTSDVNLFLTILNNITKGIITFSEPDTTTYCEKPVEPSTGLVATFFTLSAILLLCVLGTLTEIIQNFQLTQKLSHFRFRNEHNCDDWYKHDDDEVGEETRTNSDHDDSSCHNDSVIEAENKARSNSLEVSPSTANETRSSVRTPTINSSDVYVRGNCLTKFLMCFSMIKNSKAILATKSAEGAITAINGIRVISLTWVIMGHVYIIGMEGMPDNILEMFNVLHRFTFLVVSNAYVSVDSFFVLSGLLVSYLTLRRVAKKGMGCSDILMLYLHRFIRLTPSLGIVILFYTNIFPIIISGPRGVISQTNATTKACTQNWWTTMLYINNFYPASVISMCLPWSWYLSNDMQFYLLSPIILMLMVLLEKIFSRRALLVNFILILWLCGISIVVTGVITGVNDIPALVSASFVPGNPRREQSQNAMDMIYDKPYCRITPYLIGIYLGYLFSRNITLKGRYRRCIALIGWSVSISVALAVIYGPWHAFKLNGTHFTDVENIIYASLHRFAWGCAIAWLIYACHNKLGSLVNSVLSFEMWIPLSRLTYGAYLTHFVVLEFVIYVNELPNHFQDTTTIFNFVGVTVISYGCSFVLTVCVEYPVFNLEKKLFNS